MRTPKGTVDPSGRSALRLAPGLIGLAAVVVVVVSLASASVALAAAGPVVTHVSAKSGPIAGGNTVTVSGKSFMSGGKGTVKKVLFGTKAATHLRVVSAGKLTVTAPSHAAGTVWVRVVAKSGAMSAKVSAARYTFKLPVPTITALSVATGPIAGGTAVTITGTHFTGATAVTFGGVAAADVSVVNDTTITCTSPAYPNLLNVNTTVYVFVETPAGTSDPSMSCGFTFTVPTTTTGVPTVTGVVDSATSQSNGVAGDTVTITGTNFLSPGAATEVDFNPGNAATGLSVVNDTTITCVVPAGSGIVDVTVIGPKGTSSDSTADWFTYNS
jgi:hypothetical protein